MEVEWKWRRKWRGSEEEVKRKWWRKWRGSGGGSGGRSNGGGGVVQVEMVEQYHQTIIKW